MLRLDEIIVLAVRPGDTAALDVAVADTEAEGDFNDLWDIEWPNLLSLQNCPPWLSF